MSIDTNEVSRQHEMIGNQKLTEGNQRSSHPDAQWFGDAGLGLFLHWGISSVLGEGDISWSMIRPRRGAVRQMVERLGPQSQGKVVTPMEYWAQAEGFDCDRYDPDKWLAGGEIDGHR